MPRENLSFPGAGIIRKCSAALSMPIEALEDWYQVQRPQYKKETSAQASMKTGSGGRALTTSGPAPRSGIASSLKSGGKPTPELRDSASIPRASDRPAPRANHMGASAPAEHPRMVIDNSSPKHAVSSSSSSPPASSPFPERRQSLDAGPRQLSAVTYNHHQFMIEMRDKVGAYKDTIQNLSMERDVARREADEANRRCTELKEALAESQKHKKVISQGLNKEISKLTGENSRLNEDLKDAKAHIFSLQPYHRDVTSEEASRIYHNLIESVEDWVQEFMRPWLDDFSNSHRELWGRFREEPHSILEFGRMLHGNPDLINAATFSETDEEIMIAIIMRFVKGNILDSALYGVYSTGEQAIGYIEKGMQTWTEPKRDQYAARAWASEAWITMIHGPDFTNARSHRIQELSIQLVRILQIFCRGQLEDFRLSMEKHCIVPAMALHETLLVSTHCFDFDIKPCTMVQGSEVRTDHDAFLDNLGSLDCRNMSQNRKKFVLEKLEPQPDEQQLRERLQIVCAFTPSLSVSRIGQNGFGAPQVICKQKTLVAWGSPDQSRGAGRQADDPTLVALLWAWAQGRH